MLALFPMDAIEFSNTHPCFGQRLSNRNYLCPVCGFLRRAPAHYVPGAPAAPRHCEQEMVCLAHRQTVAATHLEQTERVRWWQAGGGVRSVGGKRQWRAVFS